MKRQMIKFNKINKFLMKVDKIFKRSQIICRLLNKERRIILYKIYKKVKYKSSKKENKKQRD